MTTTKPWLLDPEKTEILKWTAFLIGFAALLTTIFLIWKEENSGAILPGCVALVGGLYVWYRESEERVIKEVLDSPRQWIEGRNPVGKIIAVLEKRPVKDVRRFRYSLSHHIPALVAELGEGRVAPIYIEIVEYCVRRESPHLDPLNCREQAMNEFRLLYKGLKS